MTCHAPLYNQYTLQERIYERKTSLCMLKKLYQVSFFNCLSPKTSMQRHVHTMYRLFFAAIKMIIFDLDFFVCLFV